LGGNGRGVNGGGQMRQVSIPEAVRLLLQRPPEAQCPGWRGEHPRGARAKISRVIKRQTVTSRQPRCGAPAMAIRLRVELDW
jgi:hypothetical protein